MKAEKELVLIVFLPRSDLMFDWLSCHCAGEWSTESNPEEDGNGMYVTFEDPKDVAAAAKFAHAEYMRSPLRVLH